MSIIGCEKEIAQSGSGFVCVFVCLWVLQKRFLNASVKASERS